MDKDQSQRKAKYILNRVDMLKALKKQYRAVVEKIATDGIETKEEHRIAQIACSIIASEFYYDETIMENKTGDDS